ADRGRWDRSALEDTPLALARDLRASRQRRRLTAPDRRHPTEGVYHSQAGNDLPLTPNETAIENSRAITS
ncbi:hypothetical protein ACFQ07_23950, partial [Actinomadura adrarensis]